jgi:hypothetical protein
MKNLYKVATAAFVGLFLSLQVTAQEPVDIALYQNNGQLEVRVRPASEFNGVFSSIVFTIKWDRSSGATLGAIQQEGAPQLYVPMMKSGAVHEHGPLNYQVYAGFGTSTLASHSTNWVAGEEYVVATIPVNGKAEFELVNDAWTAEREHNANYYVSLNGHDKTGIIYKSLASADEDAQVVIQPNPNNGHFTFSFVSKNASDITVEVVNSLGQSVFTDTKAAFEGTYRKEMDISSMSNGVYYLKVKRGEHTTVHKIVYR